MKPWLSPTALKLFKDCPRCGFDATIVKFKRPKGAFPSLPNGVDAVVKRYMDQFRGTLPPELAHLEGHRLMDEQATIDKYRIWNGLKTIYNVTVNRPTETLPERKVTHTMLLNGGIDDALYNDTGQAVVFDVKTRKDEPDEDYGMKYYTTQVNCYGWMLKENGFDVADYGYLWYWWPVGVNAKGIMQFGQKTLKMPVDFTEAPRIMDEIAANLPPVSFEALQYRQFFKSASDCEYCSWVQEANNYEQAEKDSLAGATG
tara:strand:+ start:24867 stop:25640 length:774 start_codon:yes stop_codon:yes gene_type:complete